MSSQSLQSSNGKKYVQLDFNQVNEKGLKPLIDALSKVGITVENVDSSNRARMMQGVGVKDVSLRLQDQQTVTLQINDSGDISGFKLNGRAVPIQQADSLGSLAKSIQTVVRQNSERFRKGLAKKALRVIDTSNTKVAVKSNVQRLKDANERRALLSKGVAELTATNERYVSQNSSIQQKIAAQQTRLRTAQALTTQLQEQLNTLLGGNHAA